MFCVMFNNAFIVREILIFMAEQPVGGKGLLIIEFTITPSQIPHIS